MPLIKLKNIVSFSSEDKIHKAENLLKCTSDAKWKCESANEKQLSVVIQLEKSVNINKIEIGNEGSAFIEVLVSRAESSTKDHCLLPVTSFMNPNESKEKSNMNRVKIFSLNDHLAKEIAEQKWDRVKIVCTQPFNKSIQYGLSFIKFYSPGDNKEEEKNEESTPKLNTGIFSLKKTDSDKNNGDGDGDGDNVKVGSTFNKWKVNKEDVEITKPKDDDEKSNKSDESVKQKANIKKTPSNESKKDEETTAKKEPLKKQPSKRKKQSDDENDSDSVKEQSKPAPKKQSTEDTKKPVVETKKVKSPERETKRTKSPEKETKDKKTIMKGVVFVLSGFQNPLRSDLRDKAIELGAKYKQDWDKDCTHLICAFKDTPKYVQVKKLGGKIVKKEWLLDCHSKSKLLDIKDYQFKEEKRRNRDESDEEDDDEEEYGKKKPTRRAATTAKRTIKKNRDDDDEDFESENSEDRDFIVNSSEEDEEYAPTESEEEEASVSTSDSNSDSDSDSKSKKKKKKGSKKSKDKKKKKTSKKKKDSSSDSDSSDDEKSKKKKANKKKKDDSSDSADDSDDKKQKKKKQQQTKKKEESSDSEADNKKKQPVKKLEKNKSTKKDESSDGDGDKKKNGESKKPFLGNDDVTPKNLPKSSTNNAKKKIEYDSDSDNDDSKKKKPVNNKTNNKNSNNNAKNKKDTKDDSSTSSTEVNSDLDEKNDKEPWELPDLFLNKNFFIYGDYSANDRKLLTRMIVAYGGVLNDYWTNDIDFVITDREWNDEFEKSQKENANLKFVNGDWLDACVKRKKLIAYEPFAVYPSV